MPGQTAHSHTSLVIPLVVHGVLLGVAIAGGAVLALGLGLTVLGLAAVVLGLAASEALLLGALRRREAAERRELGALEASLRGLVDAQGLAVRSQESQIANLQAALGESSIRAYVRGELNREAAPRLEAVISRLEQAEAVVPELASQTRAWVSEVRRLATQAQAHVQTLGEERAGR